MKRDNKMVAVNLRFWTNNLDLKEGGVQRVVVWDSGVAKIEQNRSKGIPNTKPLPFNCFEDIMPLLKELFRKHKVYVVSDNRLPRVLSHRRTSK